MAQSSGIRWEQSSATVKVGETVTVPVTYGEVPTWDVSRDLNNLATAVVNGQSVVFTGIKAGTVTIAKNNINYLNDFTLTVEANDTQVIVAEQSLQDIADSIRTKLGTSDTYLPSEMSAAIDSISGGGSSGTENLTETKVTISPSNIVNKFYDISLNSSDNVVKVGIPTDSSSSNTQLILNSQIEVVKIDRKTSSSENLSIRVKFNNVPESSVVLSVFSLNVLDFSFEQSATNKDKVYNLFRRLLSFRAEEDLEINFSSSSAGAEGYVSSSDIYYYLDRAFLTYFVENSTFTDSQVTSFIENYKYLFNYFLNNKKSTIPRSTVACAQECFKSLGATSFQYNNSSSKDCHELVFNGNTIAFNDYSNSINDPMFYNDDLLKQMFPYIKAFSLSSCQKLSSTTYFTYDSTTNTTLVSGTGNTYGLLLPRLANSNTPFYGQLRSSQSIVFGPNISTLDYDSCDPLATKSSDFPSLVNFVFMQPRSMSVTLKNGGSGSSYLSKTPCWFYNPKSAPSTKPTFNIYTDNNSIKNFSYTSNATVNIYPLSEWEGPLVS